MWNADASPGIMKPTMPSSRSLEQLWMVHTLGRFWSGHLRDVSPWGWEFVLLRDNDLHYSQRFGTREAAIAEGEEQRQLIERGWVDAE